jgi:preprotein translocase subunit YajC
MFKFFAKQFFYGRAFLWVKEKLANILLPIVLLFLVFYIHREYLNYIDFKSQNEGNYIGTSFIIKNVLIILILIGYFYFHRIINKTKKSFKSTQETIKKLEKNSNNKVKSLDEFLEDDELNR